MSLLVSALLFNRNGQSRLILVAVSTTSLLQLAFSLFSSHTLTTLHRYVYVSNSHLSNDYNVHCIYGRQNVETRFPSVSNCKGHYISSLCNTCSAPCSMHIASTPSNCSCMSSEEWNQHSVMCTIKKLLLHPPSTVCTAPLCLLQLPLLH
jgi:hypothetical protein